MTVTVKHFTCFSNKQTATCLIFMSPGPSSRSPENCPTPNPVQLMVGVRIIFVKNSILSTLLSLSLLYYPLIIYAEKFNCQAPIRDVNMKSFGLCPYSPENWSNLDSQYWFQ